MDWASGLLRKALTSHHVPHRDGEDGAVVLKNGLLIQAYGQERAPQNGVYVVQLDVLFAGEPVSGGQIVHRFGGHGDSPEAAKQQAVERFLQLSFHPMLCAVGDHACEIDPTWEAWTGAHGNWRVCLSPVILLGFEQPQDVPLALLLDQLKAAFLEESHEGVQSADVFFAFMDGSVMQRSATLNNDEWSSGQRALDAWDCPAPPGYATGRMIMLAIPV